jgi:hypothetical protein
MFVTSLPTALDARACKIDILGVIFTCKLGREETRTPGSWIRPTVLRLNAGVNSRRSMTDPGSPLTFSYVSSRLAVVHHALLRGVFAPNHANVKTLEFAR